MNNYLLLFHLNKFKQIICKSILIDIPIDIPHE